MFTIDVSLAPGLGTKVSAGAPGLEKLEARLSHVSFENPPLQRPRGAESWSEAALIIGRSNDMQRGDGKVYDFDPYKRSHHPAQP